MAATTTKWRLYFEDDLFVKRLQAVLIAAAGAAAAIPGMVVLSKFEVPGGAQTAFSFVLAVFSAGTVLLFHTFQKNVAAINGKYLLLSSIAGLVAVFIILVAHVWLSNKVMVEYNWQGSRGRQFFPLFLPQSIDSKVDSIGSRSRYIATYGPDRVRDFMTEWNVTTTWATLLATYSVLVIVLACLFGLLGVRALATRVITHPNIDQPVSDSKEMAPMVDETQSELKPQDERLTSPTALNHVRELWRFHSEERQRNFDFFIFIAAALLTAFAFASPDGKITLALLGILVSTGFLVLDIRNFRLILDTRSDLYRLEEGYGIQAHGKDRIRDPKLGITAGSGRSRLVSHTFIYRSIYIVTAVTFSVVLFRALRA